MRRFVLSFFGTGYLRPAPGTWGSLSALPFAWVLHTFGGPGSLILAIGLLYALGVYLTTLEIKESADHDPSWIVIDEVVGQWIALLPVSLGAYFAGVEIERLWPGFVTAFLAFRLFDIWKPWLAGKADRRGDAMGVMLDDVWAGVFAALVVVAMAAAVHAGLSFASNPATP